MLEKDQQRGVPGPLLPLWKQRNWYAAHDTLSCWSLGSDNNDVTKRSATYFSQYYSCWNGVYEMTVVGADVCCLSRLYPMVWGSSGSFDGYDSFENNQNTCPSWWSKFTPLHSKASGGARCVVGKEVEGTDRYSSSRIFEKNFNALGYRATASTPSHTTTLFHSSDATRMVSYLWCKLLMLVW
jgi:hypothetical protein